MGKKYYAVKKGRVPGIYTTWDACKAQVGGFSGAEYKGFEKKEEALEFLGLCRPEDPEASPCAAIAYTDGSYNIHDKRFSYGVIIFWNGQEYTFSKAFADPSLAAMRNVAGEIKGAERVMEFCLENGIPSVELFYDYEGIEKWCTGVWKANKEGTIAYRNYYLEAKKQLQVTFTKVKGHSGDRYNDLVDRLAKDALGIV